MPDRLPPFILSADFEVRPSLDVDWTLCPEDWAKELRHRLVRNTMIKEALLDGKAIKYRSSGWSLYPKVHSNDECTYAPFLQDEQDIEEGDIVFCEVQPGDRFYAHFVKAKWWDDVYQGWYFTISNLSGRENGWCGVQHIYGRLVHVRH